MKLYDFQNDCVDDILSAFSKHRSVCLSWYTGAGKTNVFSEMCRTLIAANPKIKIGISAYLTREIKEQVTERLHEFGLGDATHMFTASAIYPKDKNIYVFNPQTIFRKPPEIHFDYFIVDESHVGIAEDTTMLRGIVAKTCSKKTKFLLVSATPWDTLALDEFKGCPVLKRPLDQGLKDGLITDFKFHAEAAQITFTPEDFTRQGDLGRTASQRNMAVLKSACIGKLKNLIGKYDKQLGRKVLVICPVGNFTEVPRAMAEQFGGLTFIQDRLLDEVDGTVSHRSDQAHNLKRFKEDPSVRFLFVANKCQVGFDMQSLSSVVDLTMSRNIKILAQRVGRVARKNGKQEKHYFYVYDQSLMKGRLEWLVSTMIDFSLGAYDGWTTRLAKSYRLCATPT
jgi:superfamily II DNA or RNA helicase